MNYKPVKSSTVSEIAHNSDTNELYVKYKSGATYVYPNVTPTDHKKLMESPSIGKHMNTHIAHRGKAKKQK